MSPFRCTLLAALLALACRGPAMTASKPAEAPPQPVARDAGTARLPDITPGAGPSCDGIDLDVVVACFHRAVVTLRDDSPPEGALLARAAATGELPAACITLPRDSSDGTLRTASGHPLRFERVDSPLDHYDDGRAEYSVGYAISCECCSATKHFTIVHTVGGPD